MKTRLNLLMVLAMLLGLLFNPGMVHAQSSASGTVVAWGANNYGQSSVPAGLGDVIAIAASGNHTLALRADGTVVAWGRNNSGQTNVPAGLSNVAAIAAGFYHSLALKADGTVVAWGDNGFGQSNVPAGLSGVTAVAAGDFHNLALKADGTVVAWGNNVLGQCTVPGGLSGVTAISAGGAHSLALKSDGTVVAWGNNTQGQSSVPLGLSSVTAIASGEYHNLALTMNGHIVGWGDNNYGQLPPSSMSGFSAIAAGSYHSLALKSDGTVVAWGENNLGQRSVPADLNGVATIAAGGDRSLALKAGSIVVGWSYSYTGQNSPPTGLSGVSAIAEGHSHDLALKADGTVVAWGLNTYGQSTVPAGLSEVTAIAAGGDHNLVLKADGTVVAWGRNTFGESTVPANLSGVTAISAGYNHSLALKADGTVVAWGDNSSGQCNVPVGLSGVKTIAAGAHHSLALKADGTVVAWGDNELGQINIPPGLNGIRAIAAVYSHNLALNADGTVVAWGDNGFGESNVPASLSGVTAISGGLWHSLALKADGTVVGWGRNDWGQVSIPAHLSGVTAIDGGQIHSLALVSDRDGDGVADGFDNCPATPNTDQADANHNGVGDICEVAITNQPESQSAHVGDTVSFSAAANGEPTPSLQWQVSTDSGTTWTDIAGATASPLTFTVSLDQNGNKYRAVFTNSAGSATSDAATLSVSKKSATVTLANLYQPYEGQPIAATVTTDPAGLSVVVTYDGSPTAPTAVGSYVVVAMVDDTTYQGSASGTLIIQPKAASVTPAVAGKVYGDNDPALSGVLVGFLEADGVIATYSRAAGEAAGSYTISATLSLSGSLDNYAITYNTAAFTIHPRSITVAAEAKSKNYGEPDPELTYTVTSGALAFNDGFNGALTRVPGEAVGVYPILQGTLALSDNYAMTFIGSELTIAAPANTAPVAQDQSVTTNENTALVITLVATDAENDSLTYSIVATPGHGTLSGTAPSVTYTPDRGYFGSDSFIFKANDGTVDSNVATVNIAVNQTNTAPTANPGGPYLRAINTDIQFDGSNSSDEDGDPLAYIWTFGDGATSTAAAPTHSYTDAGIYDVCLTVNDGTVDSSPACTLAVVYDPSAGFVTGGGWIDSQPGAYKADETLAGKATFGFISKYQKGTSVPTGTTAFEFELAGLAFSSQSYEWLVVNQGGINAQFKGSGLINELPDTNGNAYKFMLWARDGSSTNSTDTFHIRIWWEDAAGEHDVYDNGIDQTIGAGNIVVHMKK